MDLAPATLDQKASFIYFVYPFLFEPKEFATRVKAIENAQLPSREQILAVWEPQKFPEDDLLFHVANYLNPKTNNHSNACLLWKLNDNLRDTFGWREKWQLLSPQGEIPFCFGEAESKGNKVVQLALFRIGVGFLIVRSKPLSNSLQDWLNFTHYFRFSSKRENVRVQALKDKWDEKTKKTKPEPFFPKLVGGIQDHSDGRGKLYEILKTLLNTGETEAETQFKTEKTSEFLILIVSLVNVLLKISKCDLKIFKINSSISQRLSEKLRLFLQELPEWWQEVFVSKQMIPFTALFVNGLPQDNIPQLLYKLQNFFSAELGNNPAPEHLQIENSSRLVYGNKQWFTFSLEGGSFVAIDPPQEKFFQQNLPNHLRDRYFLLFLIALHQRFALMMLSAKVAENWVVGDGAKVEEKREKLFEEIRSQLLLFTARGYFTQVMQREHHHRYYRQWHQVFELERLYQEVNDEVTEMHEYSLMQQSRRLERTIQIVGVAAGTGGIVASSTANYITKPLTLAPKSNADTIHPGFLSLLLSVIIGVIAGALTWLGTGGVNWLLAQIKESRNPHK